MRKPGIQERGWLPLPSSPCWGDSPSPTPRSRRSAGGSARSTWRPAGTRASTAATSTAASGTATPPKRSEEHTSELQSLTNLVCRLLLEKKNKKQKEPDSL